MGNIFLCSTLRSNLFYGEILDVFNWKRVLLSFLLLIKITQKFYLYFKVLFTTHPFPRKLPLMYPQPHQVPQPRGHSSLPRMLKEP